MTETDNQSKVDLESRIIEICKESSKGVTDAILQASLPNVEASQRVKTINKLLSLGKLDLMKQGNQLLYRLKNPDSLKKVTGADDEEKLIYQIIEDAGNIGIWIRDIRYKSNLLLTQVNKVLKSLEGKKLIKAIKSVSASKKKVYMLYDLQPDRSVTGGAWYSDQDFESEFVEVLNQQCYKYLQQKKNLSIETNSDPISQSNASYVSLHDVWRYISDLGISKVKLSPEDIETILNLLIYDGKVEKSIVAGGSDENSKLFRAVNSLLPTTGLMRMPCGVCPVFHECEPGGAVSPSTCKYFKDWLDY